MPKKASGNFNQVKYMQEWSKENMLQLSFRYKKSFVEEFKKACDALSIKQSDVIRKAMQDTIDQAKRK